MPGWPCRAFSQKLGALILKTAPWLMKFLSVAGTVAMFLVGGGILVHGVPALHHAIQEIAAGLGGVLQALLPTLLDGVIGVIAGALVLAVVSLGRRLLGRRPASA
jgi:uncharacterized protein